MSQLQLIAAGADDAMRIARSRLEDAVLEAAEAGRTQREIASEVGRSQPEVARLIRRARDRRDRRWQTASETARAIAGELDRGDEDFAFRLVRQLLDTFRRLEPEQRATFLSRRPTTGDHRWDTLIRAAIGWVCHETGHPAPAWASVEALDTFWLLRPERALAGRLVQRTPTELALVGIFIDAESLTGV
jgi:predicted transcriptional regulator